MDTPKAPDYGHTIGEHRVNWPAVIGISLLVLMVALVLVGVAR